MELPVRSGHLVLRASGPRYGMRQQNNKGNDLGLQGGQCITLKQERLVQEAPAAYKAIGPVVDIQALVDIVAPVARMRPLLTFKA